MRRAPFRMALVLACLLPTASSWGLDENLYRNWIIVIAVYSEEAPSQHHFDQDERAGFKIRCAQGTMQISVILNSKTTKRDQRSIKMRLDDKLVEAPEWNHDSSNDQSFFQGNPWKFVRRLKETRTLSIEYGKGFRDQEISATFDLSGFKELIEPVQALCDL